MRADKKAFTIVELLMVIAVIAILAGIITMGIGGMFYKSRMGKALALRSIMQGGIETYYAQRGEWPGDLDKIAKKDKPFDSGKDYYVLTPEEVDSCFEDIVGESWGGNSTPVMDISGLFVIKKSRLGNTYGCTDIHKSWENARDKNVVVTRGETKDIDHKCNGRCPRGRDFSEATKKGASDRITSAGDVYYGYLGPNNGCFCRFRIHYFPKSDTVKVLLQRANEHHESGNDKQGYIDE